MQFVLNNWYLFFALAVIVVLLVVPNITQQMHGIKNLAPAQAVLLVNREAGVFLDVSEPSEYKAGHVPNAINIPLGTLRQSSAPLDKHKERPVIVIGRTGTNRALKAATLLRKRGFASVHVLAGGLPAWEKENLPLER